MSEDSVRKYIHERRLVRSLDPDLIHALHTGTDREAEITVADLTELLGTIAELRATIANRRRRGFDFGDDKAAGSTRYAKCGCCGKPATQFTVSKDLASCDYCAERCRAPGSIDRNWYHGVIPEEEA